MKYYIIPPRLAELSLVLQYCTHRQEAGFKRVFSIGQRICINQERNAILSGGAYTQSQLVDELIQTTLNKIKLQQWHPEFVIDFPIYRTTESK